MDPKLKLAGHILRFIIDKSLNMKTGENKTTGGSPRPVSKVVGTLAAGAAVGLAAGILLAPAKGKKTRAKLMEEAKGLKDQLKKKANEFANPKVAKKINGA